MSATYFRKGRGHSLRGQLARGDGAVPWSQLPAALRRGLSSKDAEALGISGEWHHAGMHAAEVFVYRPGQVEAFWDSLDTSGVTALEAREFARAGFGIKEGRMREIIPLVNDAASAAGAWTGDE